MRCLETGPGSFLFVPETYEEVAFLDLLRMSAGLREFPSITVDAFLDADDAQEEGVLGEELDGVEGVEGMTFVGSATAIDHIVELLSGEGDIFSYYFCL